MKNIKTLAQFVSATREHLGYSLKGLAERCNLDLATIQSIESGEDLFLASSVRQKLAKGLRVELIKIKSLEREPQVIKELNQDYIEELKLRILEGTLNGNICPLCKSELVCKVIEMFDIEHNTVRHPKARCSVCPFQIK